MATLHQTDELEARQELKEPQVSPIGRHDKSVTEKKLNETPKKSSETEGLKMINMRKEWKLLYIPYPFNGNQINLNGRYEADDDMDTTLKKKGLCATCIKLDTCTFPKLEGGVWHCADYE